VREFKYDSGERQTAFSYGEVRRDHRVRYELAAMLIKGLNLGGPDAWGLDAFCGNGYGTGFVSSTTGTPMLGIDASAEAVSVAAAKFATPGTFFAQKFFPFSLPKAAFDFVISFESIEHVDDGAALIRELARAAKPGGFIFGSVPNETRMPLGVNHNRFHVRHYTMDEITALLADNGATVLERHGQDAYAMDGLRITGTLPEERMGLSQNYDGQFIIFIARKD